MHICKTVEDLDGVAYDLLEKNRDEKVFAIYGKMGAGKTTFIKALCKQLESKDVVNSPTFAIVNEYRTATEDSLYHFDFYRIKNEWEALEIGFEEYVYSDSYCFIEWPEKIENLLPDKAIRVTIEVNEKNESRLISWKKAGHN